MPISLLQYYFTNPGINAIMQDENLMIWAMGDNQLENRDQISDAVMIMHDPYRIEYKYDPDLEESECGQLLWQMRRSYLIAMRYHNQYYNPFEKRDLHSETVKAKLCIYDWELYSRDDPDAICKFNTIFNERYNYHSMNDYQSNLHDINDVICKYERNELMDEKMIIEVVT